MFYPNWLYIRIELFMLDVLKLKRHQRFIVHFRILPALVWLVISAWAVILIAGEIWL